MKPHIVYQIFHIILIIKIFLREVKMIIFFFRVPQNQFLRRTFEKLLQLMSGEEKYKKKELEELLLLYDKNKQPGGKCWIASIICEKIIEKYKKEGKREEFIKLITKFLEEKRECAGEYEVLKEIKFENSVDLLIKRWLLLDVYFPYSNEKLRIINTLKEIGGEKGCEL
jgi:hypothetical protein